MINVLLAHSLTYCLEVNVFHPAQKDNTNPVIVSVLIVTVYVPLVIQLMFALLVLREDSYKEMLANHLAVLKITKIVRPKHALRA